MPMTNTQNLINAIQRAQNENMMVFQNGGQEGGFIVANGDKAYTVSVVDGEITKCSCPHSTSRNVICKHMIKLSLDKNINIAQLNLVTGE